jgi:hypothetical protein
LKYVRNQINRCDHHVHTQTELELLSSALPRGLEAALHLHTALAARRGALAAAAAAAAPGDAASSAPSPAAAAAAAEAEARYWHRVYDRFATHLYGQLIDDRPKLRAKYALRRHIAPCLLHVCVYIHMGARLYRRTLQRTPRHGCNVPAPAATVPLPSQRSAFLKHRHRARPCAHARAP